MRAGRKPGYLMVWFLFFIASFTAVCHSCFRSNAAEQVEQAAELYESHYALALLQSESITAKLQAGLLSTGFTGSKASFSIMDGLSFCTERCEEPEQISDGITSPIECVKRNLSDRGGIRTVRKSLVTKYSPTGSRIARYAKSRATGNGHQCYLFVANALLEAGIHLEGGSAYMAAHQLAVCPKVREVRISGKEQLDSLPQGAIAVWDRDIRHRDGHISISLGNRKEVSDVVRDQMLDYGSSFRVFVPHDMIAFVRQAEPAGRGQACAPCRKTRSGSLYAELR